MSNTLNSLRSYANKITLSIAFVIFFLFTGIAFPYHANNLFEVTGKMVRTLDVRWSYNQQDVLTLFSDMQEAGRLEYQIVEGITDMIYPLVYGILIILLILSLTKILSVKRWWLLLFLPILTMLFDYSENTMILRMLDSYPDISPEMVSRSSTLSSIKWTFAFLSVSTVMILGVLNFLDRNKQKGLNTDD